MGIMPRPPPKPTDRVPRPGVIGFFQDRVDHIKLAFNNYLKDQDARRAAISKIGKDKHGSDVKYETRTKGKADKSATAAGLVEKLK